MISRAVTTRAAAVCAATVLTGAFGVASASATVEPPTGSDANQAANWEAYYEANEDIDVTCWKVMEDGADWTGDTFTLGAAEAGTDWYSVIIKAASANTPGVDNPNHEFLMDAAGGELSEGDEFTFIDSTDKQRTISHVIVCSTPVEEPTGEETTPTDEETTPTGEETTPTDEPSDEPTDDKTGGVTDDKTDDDTVVGPVVETDIPAKDGNAPWLLTGAALALVGGAAAAGSGLRRQAAKH